jgi:TspO/MBR family
MGLRDIARRVWPVPVLTIGLLGAGAIAGRPDDPDYYRSLKQAPFAPPSWVFGPAWTIAKAGASAATLRAAHRVQGPDRRRLAVLAALDAGIFVTFSYVYFASAARSWPPSGPSPTPPSRPPLYRCWPATTARLQRHCSPRPLQAEVVPDATARFRGTVSTQVPVPPSTASGAAPGSGSLGDPQLVQVALGDPAVVAPVDQGGEVGE